MNAVRHKEYRPSGVMSRTPTWCLRGWRPTLPNKRSTHMQWEVHMRASEAWDRRVAEAAPELLEAALAVLSNDRLTKLLTMSDRRILKEAVSKATGEQA